MTPTELWWWVSSTQEAETFGKKHKITRAEVRHMYEKAYGPTGEP